MIRNGAKIAAIIAKYVCVRISSFTRDVAFVISPAKVWAMVVCRTRFNTARTITGTLPKQAEAKIPGRAARWWATRKYSAKFSDTVNKIKIGVRRAFCQFAMMMLGNEEGKRMSSTPNIRET